MHQEILRRLLPYKAGVLSHGALNAGDGALFAQCFTAWVEGMRVAALASISVPEVVA